MTNLHFKLILSDDDCFDIIDHNEVIRCDEDDTCNNLENDVERIVDDDSDQCCRSDFSRFHRKNFHKTEISTEIST